MSNEQTVRVGIVGAGGAGAAHIRSYRALNDENVQLVAIADPRLERLKELQVEYDIPHIYEDFNDLIVRDDIDLISIATPNFLHGPVAIAALEASKHVLTEKPFSISTADAEKMVEASEKHNRVLHVVYNQRRHQDVETLKTYIDQGSLGRIYHAKASWMRRKGIPGMGGWFTTKEFSGGGPLIDLGIHVLDMVLHLMGEPTPVTVSAATYAEIGPQGKGGWKTYKGMSGGDNPYDVEDLATAFIRFDDGATLLLEASWAVYGRKKDDFGVTLYGTQGGGEIDIRGYKREDNVTIFTDVGDVPAVLTPDIRRSANGGHIAVVQDIVNIIRSGDWDGHHGRGGLTRTRIIDACYASAELSKEVSL